MKLFYVASIFATLCATPSFAGGVNSQSQEDQDTEESSQQEVDTAAVKVALCHFDQTDGAWVLLSLPQGAANSHLRRHDDALAGGITAKTQTQLDANCLPVVAAPAPVPASAQDQGSEIE